MTQKTIYLLLFICIVVCGCNKEQSINRYEVVSRNNPIINQIDSLSSLSVGNGEFAFTVDATGLQTFQEKYKMGVPLGTQSQWGWHSFPNPQNLQHDETLRDYDFGRGKTEPYAVQFNAPKTPKPQNPKTPLTPYIMFMQNTFKHLCIISHYQFG